MKKKKSYYPTDSLQIVSMAYMVLLFTIFLGVQYYYTF